MASITKMAQKFMNHTCFRIADPKRSLEFYEKYFGMKLLKTSQKSASGNTEYILGLTGPQSLYKDAAFYNRGGLLQLSHNEQVTTENFQANNGNKEPHRGFGHICFSVPNLESVCSDLEKAGVQFQKRLSDGRQKDIAFALDPDGYWIELISNDKEESASTKETYRLNHSMIRVKDKEASLQFYVSKLGMTLVDTLDFPNASFTLYFLSFDPQNVKEVGRANTEGLIELTYNYGSEKDDGVKYHTGNTAPKGFSHFGISVDNPTAFVEQLKKEGIQVVQGLENGAASATVTDPDGYAIKILPKDERAVSAHI